MRAAAIFIFLLTGIHGLALAEPVAMRDAMFEMRKRGFTQIEGVVLSGTPVISGAVDEQGFSASMFKCDQESFACRVAIFRTCKSLSGLSLGDALQIANAYNLKTEPRGYMLVDSHNSGASVCVQSRFDFDGDNSFDQSETFNWQETVRDFVDYVDDEERSIRARSILGGGSGGAGYTQ